MADAPIEDALLGRPEEIWALRHARSEGVKSAGPPVAFDLGSTRDKVITLRAEMTRKLAADFPMVQICDFGHLGDGGLHFNLVKTDRPMDAPSEQALRDHYDAQAVHGFGGSFSEKHGIGPKSIKCPDKSPAHMLTCAGDNANRRPWGSAFNMNGQPKATDPSDVERGES